MSWIRIFVLIQEVFVACLYANQGWHLYSWRNCITAPALRRTLLGRTLSCIGVILACGGFIHQNLAHHEQPISIHTVLAQLTMLVFEIGWLLVKDVRYQELRDYNTIDERGAR